ncbi:hypothetical protein F1654_04920 [Alkalicaulis satelles]|uniref:Uncharacterized protein n=2 Tax=Alkalicaulis satelles TaxID=2609175 RepID=A0A5M6ZKH4_9PROT|nr:hypothetical protein F1654_04920 [Alkalicaulis satelles]
MIAGLAFILISIKYILTSPSNSNFMHYIGLSGLGVGCIALSNLAKFKKIKFSGFEAEMWGDTQKEAERITHNLKRLLDILSTRVIFNEVDLKTLENNRNWESVWELYFIIQHEYKELDISGKLSTNLTKLKSIFIYHSLQCEIDYIHKKFANARSEIENRINEMHSRSEIDADERALKLKKLDQLQFNAGDVFEKASNRTLGVHLNIMITEGKKKIEEECGVDIEITKEVIDNINYVQDMERDGNFAGDERIISLTERSMNYYYLTGAL